MPTSLIAFSWGFKQASKKLLLLAVPCFCLFLSGHTFAASRSQSEPIVPACHIKLSSFLQPWGDRYSAEVEQWESVFKRHKELGFQTVILQWSHWGKRPYGEPIVPDWLKSALVAARNTKVSLKIGTLYDPEFDRGLNGEKPIWYLKKHHDWNLAFASNLSAFLKLHPELMPAFSGWYISDEVDSGWLLVLSKKRLLAAYFQDMGDSLKKTINAPVSMTGYTQAASVSAKLAKRWAAFLDNTLVDTLYSQDGIGASLQTHKSAAVWNELLDEVQVNQKWNVAPVAEIFNSDQIKHGEKFRLASIDENFNRMLIASSATSESMAVFSISEYALAENNNRSKRLIDYFLQRKLRCE